MPVARILVTGFEPNDDGLNASQAVVESLIGDVPVALRPFGDHLHLAVLPGNTHTVSVSLIELIEEHQPNFCVLVGQAPGRSKVTFERVATNLRDFMVADRAGNIETGSHIFAEAPAAYFSTLDALELANSWRAPASQQPPPITPGIIFAIKRCSSHFTMRQHVTSL